MNLLSLPMRWLRNIIVLQEKKHYNFYVIIIFALFVGFVRYLLEFILGWQAIRISNISLSIIVSFYLFSIFGYTLILKLCIPDFEWKKSIHLVLIGVFLGIFPPLLDFMFTGLGSFKYPYITDANTKQYIWFEDLPLGETIVLFLTMFFTSLVIFIKTESVLRALAGFILSYCFVYFYAAGLPTYVISEIMEYFLKNTEYLQGESRFKVDSFYLFSLPFLIIAFQVFLTAVMYLFLNPGIFSNVCKRFNHALPLIFTALLGYSVYRPITEEAIFFAIIFGYLGIVIILQNDFFDKEEDALSRKGSYVNGDDVIFFNVTFLMLCVALASNNYVSVYPLILCFIASVIYNYDFYRGKSFFPSNYKIEGVWGFSAYIGGVCLVYDSSESFTHKSAAMWSWEYVLFVFLVFGGWSIISVIKDYKDIEGDAAVGNQTAYTLLQKRGYNIFRFHKNYTRVLSLLLFVPFLWLLKIDAHAVFYVLMGLSVVTFYWVINWPPSNKAVESALGAINAYLLFFALACHFSH